MTVSPLTRWLPLLAATVLIVSCEREPELFANQVIWIEWPTSEGLVWMTPGIECLAKPSPNAARLNVQTLDVATASALQGKVERHNQRLSPEVVAATCKR
jgi:hypothetical protein